MPQILKDEIRIRIKAAALEELASQGFADATMAAIAERARIGTASIYRYYPSKDELFEAVLPAELVRRFEVLLERRVSALARSTLRGEPIDDAGDEMLRFWVDHRLPVIVLLDRAGGSAYAGYGERFVELLVKHTLTELRATHPGLRITPTARFVITCIFDNTRRLLARVLEQHSDPSELREAVQIFWSYQIAGLHGLARWLAAS